MTTVTQKRSHPSWARTPLAHTQRYPSSKSTQFEAYYSCSTPLHDASKMWERHNASNSGSHGRKQKKNVTLCSSSECVVTSVGASETQKKTARKKKICVSRFASFRHFHQRVFFFSLYQSKKGEKRSSSGFSAAEEKLRHVQVLVLFGLCEGGQRE